MIEEVNEGRFEVRFAERLRALEAGAEMASLNVQTVVAYSGEHEVLFSTSPRRCDELARVMLERAIKPEFEVFAPSDIGQVNELIRSDLDKPPHAINLALGFDRIFQGAMPYSPKTLQFLVELLPPACHFSVSGWQEAQLPATTQSVILGGHVRVGLEDSTYYATGVLATNQDLVRRAVRIIRDLNCEPATPAEARRMLGLPTTQTSD